MDSEESASSQMRQPSSHAKTDHGDTQSISSSGQTKSISASRDSSSRDSVEDHRNMIIASLLEDYIRTRAAEVLNAANPGKNYTRQSPEIQPLVRQLFAEASHKLSENGILAESATTDGGLGIRRQYLSAVDNIMANSQTLASSVSSPVHGLVSQASQLALVPHLSQLDLQSEPQQSHYRSSFRELALLGKGGFGKVYRCFNPLDQKTYAVKKIQLSPKLGKRFRDGRLEELQHILREVQALATLDHPNIVRYHATWLEDPHQFPSPLIMDSRNSNSRPRSSRHQQLLLSNHPFSQETEGEPEPEPSLSGGVIFEADTLSLPDKESVHQPQWFEKTASSHSPVESPSLSSTSDIFTDGKGHLENSSQRHQTFDATGHTLYIQMSLYPMTLAQYISFSSNDTNIPKHCFHLIPSLRLLHSIHSGLRYIHSKGFLHRDIKPGNIFLSLTEEELQGGSFNLSCNSCQKKTGEVSPRWINARIGDFGLVAQLARGELPLSPYEGDNSTPTSDKRPVGTTNYRPPPFKGADDEKVDIFALGVVFVEMLCRCSTAMERAEMFKGLQLGCVPSSLEESLEGEGHPAKVVNEVVSLAKAMVDPDPKKRWSSSQESSGNIDFQEWSPDEIHKFIAYVYGKNISAGNYDFVDLMKLWEMGDYFLIPAMCQKLPEKLQEALENASLTVLRLYPNEGNIKNYAAKMTKGECEKQIMEIATQFRKAVSYVYEKAKPDVLKSQLAKCYLQGIFRCHADSRWGIKSLIENEAPEFAVEVLRQISSVGEETRLLPKPKPNPKPKQSFDFEVEASLFCDMAHGREGFLAGLGRAALYGHSAGDDSV
ncbi:kinase-like domain-containing protein [Annulohypoxylon truncatum]|uniref:kinase-like domain-containing protein n=1 Tax=Annulohypoxylon truncatum TaxID=327061 RepID=UPI002007A1A7|nr:kinase-like domain-containing protein [Annulohypoxylon truncatum]KAI1212056.1 kinase-like domain-containing protein [Annulohypoxylon truncatum]